MARRITWTESAWQEVECAAAFIERDSRRYAAALIEEARDTGRSLKTFPMRGRVVPETNDQHTREVFIRNYRLIYRIQDKHVVILAFIHGARRFPTELLQ